MSQQHVVHSCTSLSFSGLERYVVEIAAAQVKAGRSVEIFCREGSDIAKEAAKRGVPVWTIAKTAGPAPWLWLSVFQQWQKRVAQHGRVVLHMHHAGELWFHLMRPKLSKTVLQYHLWINHAKNDPFHRVLFSSVDELWCSSESASSHLKKLLPLAPHKFRVVSYGRPYRALSSASKAEWREEIRRSLKIPQDAVVGVTIARIEPIKGIAELFEAFVMVAPTLPDAHLVIVGGASPENDEAADFASALERRHLQLDPRVRNRIHFTGFASKVERYMAASDFYILPSYEECMSLALLDALILGLPAIGTDAGGTPSVVRENETGIVVPPRQIEPLAEAMAKLYQQADLRAQLAKGAASLGPRFDETSIFEHIWASYGENKKTQPDLTSPMA